jgi:hypothetical protein
MLSKKPYSGTVGKWDSDGSQAVSLGKARDENILEIDNDHPSGTQKLQVN